MPVKAIETVYNGYRFRSRIEARWAVFFDALHIRWEYDSEDPCGPVFPIYMAIASTSRAVLAARGARFEHGEHGGA